MKPTQEQKEQYFSEMAMSLVDAVKLRVEKFHKEYEEKSFGKQFFLDIEYRNVLSDLIYFRNKFKMHLSICIENGISKNSFPYEHIGGFYLKQLEDIELKGFISVLKLNNPHFGWNEKSMKLYNERMNKIAKEIMDKILNEEQIKNSK